MGEHEGLFSDSAHQKTLKTAKTLQKVFDDSQNADLCNTEKISMCEIFVFLSDTERFILIIPVKLI
jgi:hypothetical protein